MKDSGRKPRARWAWLESRAVAPGEVARRLDRARRGFLDVGALFAATRLSIVLVVLLARTGRHERIQTVIDDLRRAVRKAQRNREIVFALYHVTNAAARGADLQEAAAEALARLRRCRPLHLVTSAEPNPASGAKEGTGDSERRSPMETQSVTIELPALRVVITWHGTKAGSGAVDAAGTRGEAIAVPRNQ